MNVKIIDNLENIKADVLLIPFFQNNLKGSRFEQANELTKDSLGQSLKNKDFEAKQKQILLAPAFGKIKRACFIGLGEQKKLDNKKIYHALSQAFLACQKSKCENFVFWSEQKLEKKIKSRVLGFLTSKSCLVSSYVFDKYITKKAQKAVKPKELVFYDLVDEKNIIEGAREGVILAEAINWTRDLGNHPAGDMTPVSMEQDVKEKCKNTAVKIKILNEEKMRKLGMGAILGVSKGSKEEARMIIMEYNGADKKTPRIVFIGKGITFDSGGISIKPSNEMDEMKFDMLGAGAVAGGIYAITQLGLKVNVVGILACAENMPSSSAFRPGDILRAYNKKTIEIINTDAEGRLVLADALSYAKHYKPKFVVDFATLTGACVVALGSHYAGLFSNDDNIKKIISSASKTSLDQIWELPTTEEYSEHIKSKIADVKNIGKGGEAGACSAAAFLKEFIDYPWAHIDIAGVAWQKADNGISHCGATGFGVQLIVDIAKKI